jgi:hypothetical protein
MQEESRCKTRAGHLITKMSRSLLLGCDFSSLGLRYSLRKPGNMSDVFRAWQEVGISHSHYAQAQAKSFELTLRQLNYTKGRLFII